MSVSLAAAADSDTLNRATRTTPLFQTDDGNPDTD